MLGKKIFFLKFVDNVVMTAKSPKELEETLRDLKKFSKESGMKVNEDNTKVIVFRKGGK